MQKKIQIFNSHPSIRLGSKYFIRVTGAILKEMGLKSSWVDITFCNDDFMMKQNRIFMGKKGTTDVLSFPQLAATPQTRNSYIFDGVYLGEILLSLDQCKRQAAELRIRLRDEAVFLIIHSLLHLVGHDHAKSGDRKVMQGEESRIWAKIRNNKKFR